MHVPTQGAEGLELETLVGTVLRGFGRVLGEGSGGGFERVRDGSGDFFSGPSAPQTTQSKAPSPPSQREWAEAKFQFSAGVVEGC